MGIGIGLRYQEDWGYERQIVAKNPDPNNFVILKCVKFENAHVLKVRYLGCTNFEGIKVLVYTGKFKKLDYRDPHFCHSRYSPIARFKPTKEGWDLALRVAAEIGGMK